jgi:hypothetical protein
MLSADQMQSLPSFFADIPDPKPHPGPKGIAWVLLLPFPPGQRCVECAATRPSRIGPKA